MSLMGETEAGVGTVHRVNVILIEDINSDELCLYPLLGAVPD